MTDTWGVWVYIVVWLRVTVDRFSSRFSMAGSLFTTARCLMYILPTLSTCSQLVTASMASIRKSLGEPIFRSNLFGGASLKPLFFCLPSSQMFHSPVELAVT